MRRWFVVLSVLLLPASAWAEGNLAKCAERLPELEIDGAKGFSVTKYEIDTYFVPIHPGTYEYYIENMREDGMLGIFVVK